MENNYSVYQHVTPDGMYYFGQTQNVEKRWSNKGSLYKGTALQPYIEKFGWDNIQHIILFENQSKEDALSIEDSLIISGWEKGNCINKIRSGNIEKEEGYFQQYYEENKQQMREQQKQYYEQNKQQILEQQKQYYEQNKQQIRKQRRQRYQKNRDEINEQRRQRYQRKKEEKQFKEFGNLPLW